MLIDEIYLRDGTNMVPVDSIEGEMIEEVILDGMTCHFAKPNDVGGQSIVKCDNAVEEPFISVEAIGNTTQPTYTGKNLALAAEIYKGVGNNYATLEYEDRECVKFTDNINIKYVIDGGFKENTQYTVSFDAKTGNNDYNTQGFVFWYSDNTRSAVSVKGVEWKHKKFTSTAGKTVVGIGTATHEYRNPIYIDINTFMFQEGAIAEPVYEPYVGGKVSPSAYYPQPMVNAGDNGMTLTVKSKNLGDIKDRTLTFNNKHYQDMATGFELLPSTTYTLSFDYDFISINHTNNLGYGIGRGATFYASDIKYKATFPNFTKGRTSYTFTTPASLGTYTKLFLRIPRSDEGGLTGEIKVSNFMITYDANLTEYEPYFEPTTIEIPSSITVGSSTIPLRMAKVEKADNIVVKDGEVIYNRNIAYLRVPHATKTYTYSTGYYYGVEFGNIAEQTLSRAKGISTHTTHVGDNPGNNIYDSFWIGVNTTIVYWIGILHTLGFNKLATKEEQVAAFNAWLDEQEAQGTPVEILYQRKTPETKDITNTDLGRQLLALAASKGTNYLEITGDASLGVSYWRQVIPNEEI